MHAFVFNYGETQLYEIVEEMWLYMENREDEVTTFSHVFGGESMHEGTIPPGCKKPVHAFFSLDLRDPRVGVKPPGKHSIFLPFYYPLGNIGGPFTYRFVDAGNIEMFSQPYPAKYRAGRMKNYPREFEAEPVELVSREYDPSDVSDVFHCGGVLGIDALTAAERAKLRKDFLQFYIDEIHTDLIAEDYEGDDSVPIEEIVSGYTPFTQGMPEYSCPNPRCKMHKSKEHLPPLLYVSPEEDDPFYKHIAGGDSGQLIWMYCRKCASFVVTNPCT